MVEQSYPQIGEEFSLPFAEGCRQILESVGFIVVDEKTTQYNYTLLVEVTGENFGHDQEKWQQWWEENK